MSEHDNTQPERSVDKLLEDLEAEKAARSREEERLGEVLKVDEHTAAKISEERKNKVSGFKPGHRSGRRVSENGGARSAVRQ